MQIIRRSPLSLLAAAILFLGVPAVVSAAPITFIFEGAVTVASPLLGGRFQTGDVLTGTLTYDSELTDSDASASIGMYAPISGFTFDLDGYTGDYTDNTGYVRVANGPPGSDQLGLRADVTGASINNFKPFNFQFGFTDSTGLVFTNDSLPLAFNTDQFTLTNFFFQFTNRANPYDLTSGGTNFTGVQGTFTGSTVENTPVPEPATMTLFATGLAAAWVRRRRQASRG